MSDTGVVFNGGSQILSHRRAKSVVLVMDHEPPHFHVKRIGEWEVKVHFLNEPETMIEVVWTNKLPSRSALKELTSLAEAHRVELFKQREEIHKHD